MNTNDLYQKCLDRAPNAENDLFSHLTARFRLFAELKIRNRLDAEEVVQTALAVVAQKYRQVDIQTSFAAWAHKVMSNEVLKFYRSRGYREKLFMQMTDDPTDSALWKPDADIEQRLLDCLRKLCSAHIRYARALNLKFQGYDATDICSRLGITVENFYVLLSRARSLLKHCLDTGDVKK